MRDDVRQLLNEIGLIDEIICICGENEKLPGKNFCSEECEKYLDWLEKIMEEENGSVFQG